MRNLFVLLLAATLVSCGAKEESEVTVAKDSTTAPTQQVPPERIQQRPIKEGDGHGFTYSYSSQSIDSIFRLPVAQRPATLEEATAYYLSMSMPPRINMPPHLLPPMDLKRVAQSDSTAIYTFKPQRGEESAQIEFLKIRRGNDSAWVVTKMLQSFNRQKRP